MTNEDVVLVLKTAVLWLQDLCPVHISRTELISILEKTIAALKKDSTKAGMTYTCNKCGKQNRIVNECRCDPNLFTTVPALVV